MYIVLVIFQEFEPETLSHRAFTTLSDFSEMLQHCIMKENQRMQHKKKHRINVGCLIKEVQSQKAWDPPRKKNKNKELRGKLVAYYGNHILPSANA